MLERCIRHREVGDEFGVDHTVITRALAWFLQNGTPVRRYVVAEKK